MNILFIDTELTWRGGENQLLLLLEQLKAEKDIKSYLAVPPQSEAYKRFTKNGLAQLLPVEMRGIKIIPAIFKLVRFCKKQKIEIINTQTSQGHQLGIFIKMFLPDISLLVHRRVDFIPKDNWIGRFKYLNKRVDHYIAISNAIGQILIDYGIPKEKISTVRSAVCPKKFQSINGSEARKKICTELDIDINTTLIASVAYLTPQKGHETLLRGLKVLKNKGANFKCIIAGDGELRESHEKLKEDLGLNDFVKFLGIRKDAYQILKAADILAMPSNYEGLGTTILDALHCDCCVVATEVGGIPEMIKDGKTGLLSKKGDGNGHGLNLLKVVEDKNLRETLAENGKRFIKEEFNVRNMADGNIKIFRKFSGY